MKETQAVATIASTLALIMMCVAIAQGQPRPTPRREATVSRVELLPEGTIDLPISRRDLRRRDGLRWQAASGWGEVSIDDERSQIAIAFIHARRAAQRARFTGRRVSLYSMVRAYSVPVSFRGGDPRRQWLLHLQRDIRRIPEQWNRAASWSAYAPKWQHILENHEAWARGRIADPCASYNPLPMHHGSIQDSVSFLEDNPDWEISECRAGRQILFSRKSP